MKHVQFTFADRSEAGRQLADRLLLMGLDQPVFYALPRGGYIEGYTGMVKFAASFRSGHSVQLAAASSNVNNGQHKARVRNSRIGVSAAKTALRSQCPTSVRACYLVGAPNVTVFQLGR